MNKLNFYTEITKVDEEQRIVEGYASTEALDSQGERVSLDALKKAFVPYMKFANIREMHTNSAVGVAKSGEFDDKGLYLSAKVVDDNAWNKVKEGVYKGFSIGGNKISKVDNVITELDLTEISLVDRPANPEAVFDVYKTDMGLEPVMPGALIESAECKDPREITLQELVDSAVEKAVAKAIESINKSESVEIVETIEAEAEIKKGMCEISNLASLLANLENLQMNVKFEEEYEGDNSELPAKLKSAMGVLVDILRAMVVEETDEIMTEKSQKTENIQKSELNQESNFLSKMADFEEKLLKMTEENKSLKEQIEKIGNMPIAGKAVLRGINKQMDNELSKREGKHDAITVMNEVFASGGVPFRR